MKRPCASLGNSLWKQQSYRSGPLFESPKPRNFIHLIHFQSTHIEMKDQQSYKSQPVKHFQASLDPNPRNSFWNETCLRSTCSFLLCSPIHLRPPRRDPMSSPKLRLVEFMEPFHGTYIRFVSVMKKTSRIIIILRIWLAVGGCGFNKICASQIASFPQGSGCYEHLKTSYLKPPPR